LQVREATRKDAAQILAFIRAKAQFDRELGVFTGELGANEEALCGHLFGPRPLAFVLLAGDADRTVGYALYYFRYSSYRGRPSIWLEDLYVEPHARRQGVARLLMSRLASLAKAANCTHIDWVASAKNEQALSFYRRLGAEAVAEPADSITLRIDPGQFA